MLRAGAAGWLAGEAAAELLLRHGCWPGGGGVLRRFVGLRPGPGPAGAQCPAGIGWRGAVDGVDQVNIALVTGAVLHA